ncbi:divalent-cation tolerance protein CutA [Vibrio tapetis]|uniref:Divalent-cation tolerance protein CutA n=1 Tax=Vibrio tapetis subsp. tapetis TaxID=1671868 RepID=A0A2N8ZMY0_9VIBR|nr:divalent-cation tolerance protein CutA [Vibrio tapetis]SON53265.1 Divalent-cation tolerance protein CutA [Vibrio tapetis subsp. tapetis]
MGSHQCCTVLTTCNNQQTEKNLIHALLQLKLVACIQVMPIESHYLWKGEVCCDNEKLLIMKSTSERFEQLKQEIVKLHDYDVPQIVQLPITAGLTEYLDWVQSSTDS